MSGQDRPSPSAGQGAFPEKLALFRPRLPEADKLLPYLKQIDDSRWYTNFGPLETRLEDRLAACFGLPEACVTCVANGTIGLLLALQQVAPLGEAYCLLPSYTFVATAHAVRAAGLKPWFLDVDPVEWSLQPDIVRAALAQVDGPVAAVMPVSPFGQPVPPGPWERFQRETGIPVVIDAAAAFDGTEIGATLTVISLHATKTLPAGEGAVVASRNAGVVHGVRARSNFGFLGSRTASVIGLNGKMSEYHAAVGLAALDGWEDIRTEWLRVARDYRDLFDGMAGVRFAPGFAPEADGGFARSSCVVAFDDPVADAVAKALSAAGIESRRWWDRGCHVQPAFSAAQRSPLPVTESLAARVLGLPFYRDLERASIVRVRDAIYHAVTGK